MSEANQAASRDKYGREGSTRNLVVRLWRDWLRRYTKLIIFSVLFMVVTAGAGSTYPLLIKLAFDVLGGEAPNPDAPVAMRAAADFLSTGSMGFLMLPLAILVVTVIAGGANYFQAVLSNSFTLQTIRDLQSAMFGHLMRADLARLQEDRTGALISRFVLDVQLMREALGKALTGMARDFLKIVFLLAVMLYLNWQLTLAVAVVFPFGARPIIRIGRRMRRASWVFPTSSWHWR